MPVEAGKNNDLFRIVDIENAVRESAKQSSSNIAVHNCEGLRVFPDAIDAPVEREQELVRKVMASLSVPREDPVNINLSGRGETEGHFFRFSDSRTSCQGRAAAGSWRCSESRRSNS